VVGALRDGAREVEEAGSEDVRGTPTTRNTTTLDLSGAEGRDEEGLPETVPMRCGSTRTDSYAASASACRSAKAVTSTTRSSSMTSASRPTVQPPPEEDTIPFQEAIAATREEQGGG
jgi:hypothetical protein